MIAMIPFTVLLLFCCGHDCGYQGSTAFPQVSSKEHSFQILIHKLFHSKEVHINPVLLLELPYAHQHNKGSEKSCGKEPI